jgi:putative membrane protein
MAWHGIICNFTVEEQRKNTSDHLANERTFLAWVRTSIGIMAFGFVVVKFSLFIRQLSILLGKEVTIKPHGYSSILGIILVAFGAFTSLLAWWRYKKTEKQIDNNNFKSSSLTTGILIAFIFLISILLIIYLVEST